MKRYTIFSLVYLVVCCGLSGQTLSIERSTYEFKGKPRPSVKVVTSVPAKYLKKNWDDYLKDEHDVKLKGIGFLANKDLLSAEETTFPALSDKTMDFYTHYREKNDVTTFHVFALFGYDMAAGRGAFADVFGPMRNVTEAFLEQQLPLYYQAQLEEEQDRAGDLQDAVSQLKEDISDYEEEMAKLRQEIAKKRDRLADKSAQLSSANASREEAAKALEQLNSLLNQVIDQ